MDELLFVFLQAEDGIRDYKVTGVQTCALPIYRWWISAGGSSGSRRARRRRRIPGRRRPWSGPCGGGRACARPRTRRTPRDRKSGVEGKRVDLGGRRII